MPPTSANSMFEIIAMLLYPLGPIAGFLLGTHTGRRSRFQLILAAALGGLVAGLLSMGLAVLASPGDAITTDHLQVYLIFTAFYVATGVLIGFAGVFARIIGPRNMVLGAFALYGGYSVLRTSYTYWARRSFEASLRGVVLTPSGAPAAHAPVYFDRDHGVTVRFSTDSAGRFRIPVERNEIRDVRLLICAPGMRPTVGRGMEGQVDETTFRLSALGAGERVNVRGFGWHGPIPRECPAEGAFLWGYPPEAGKPEGAVSIVEPGWGSVVSSLVPDGASGSANAVTR